MAKMLCRCLFLFTLIILFIPMCVFAHDNSDLNLSDTNDSSVVSDCDNITNQQDNIYLQNQSNDNSDLPLNNNVANVDADLDTIKNIIGDSISVGLLECQAYEYDDSNKSVLDTEVENEVKNKLTENNFDYNSLGYEFAADFVRYGDFDYTGVIRVFHNSLYLDQISASVTYSNTNEHTVEEQAYVDDFINNNQFVYENELSLEDYFDDDFDLEDRISSFADQHNIESISLTPYNIGGTNDFSFACFYNHKYYGKLIATLNETIKVKVPNNVTNKNTYILNKVKEFFINKYNEMGITDFINNDTDFYYRGNSIFAKDSIYGFDFRIGTFVADIVNVPVVNPLSNPSETHNGESNYSSYDYYYRTYYTYYDEESDSQTGGTLGSADTVLDINDIIKSDSKELKTTNNNKSNNKDVEKKEDNEKGKMSPTKILFIVLAGVLLAGIAIAIINKIPLNSESSIDV